MDYFSASWIIAFIHTLTCLVIKISSPRWSLKNLHLQDAPFSFTSLMISSGWSAWHLAGMVLVLNRCSWFPFLRMRALCLDAQLSFSMNSWILHRSDLGVSRSLCSGFSAVIQSPPSPPLSLTPMHPFLPSHFDICTAFLSRCGNDGNKTTRTWVWAHGLLFDMEKLILTLPVHPECEQINTWDYGKGSLPLSGWESKSITNRIAYPE